MSIISLRDTLREADHEHIAVGHFNFCELVVLKAVAAVARQLRVPVLVGVSESEREFIGVRQAAALVKSIRSEFVAAYESVSEVVRSWLGAFGGTARAVA